MQVSEDESACDANHLKGWTLHYIRISAASAVDRCVNGTLNIG